MAGVPRFKHRPHPASRRGEGPQFAYAQGGPGLPTAVYLMFTLSPKANHDDKGKPKNNKGHPWVKVHLMCGVKTNIVTPVEIGEPTAADTKLLPPMLATAAKHFKVSEVSGDKGYSSEKNMEIVAAAGATPFIAFQEHVTGKGGGMWSKMFGYFQYRREEFLAHYHKRSNVESTFSMIKRKFGDGLRSRTDTAMRNETLCKVLAHNLVVLIHEMYELGIDPMFWGNGVSPTVTSVTRPSVPCVPTNRYPGLTTR